VSSYVLRQQWGKAGRDRVIEHYEWNACVDRMLMILAQSKVEYRGS
jgi:hypothetical protein